MNPIYKFQLSAGNDTRQAFPVYKDDLAIDYALEQNQEFYRGKLSGKLTFQKDDYLFIRLKAFDTQFDVVISISYDGGQTWAVYWSGQFWKTDCQFNEDDQTAIVTPNVNDCYNAVLAGMDKEYNLIDLAPVIQAVKMKKRPCLQIYIPGAASVGQIMFGNNTYWETECKPKTFAEIGAEHFGSIADQYPIQLGLYNTYPPAEEIQLFSTTPIGDNVNINYGQFTLQISLNTGTPTYDILLTRLDGAQWRENQAATPSLATLTAVPNTGAEYQYVDYTTLQSLNVFGRVILDNENIPGVFELENDDMVENNRNYRYCLPFNGPDNDLVILTSNKTTTPTKYGIYQPGIYYDVPSPNGHWLPVARNTWVEYSIWINVDHFQTLNTYDETFSKDYVLKDTYPIWSVISVLLAKVAPGITHDGTTDYSQFLYGTNLIGITQTLLITPKSNLITAGYDQPAQKAPITLKRVMDMLRDCFRCYWFIDNQNRFRIEHISYFMNGGAYPGTPNFPVVGIDLTQQIVTRNGKSWAYARNQYEFDKPEMAARYQFGWMDDVTELFDGYPIDIISKYVNPDNIEQIDVSQFTSDVDYILLNPGEISKDGFVLLAATRQDFSINATSQNGYLTIDGTYVGLQNYKSKTTQIIQCEPGQRFYYKGRGQWPAMSVLYYNNDTIVGYDSFYSESDYVVITIPDGANKVVFSSFAPSSGTVILSVYTGGYELPCINFRIDGSDHYLQNAYVAFCFLQQYYMFDMPAWNVEINGVEQWVRGIKKLKTQTIKFPVLTEPDLVRLVKTNMGNGTIEKLSVNLSSRNANATLKYDTE